MRPTAEVCRLEDRCLLAGPYASLTRAEARDYYLDVFRPLEDVPADWSGSVVAGDAGRLGSAYKAAVLARFNAYRSMAGLPDNVVLDDLFSQRAQAAALMMSANRELSHTPPSSWIDYTEEGRIGAGSSNLFLGVAGVHAIDGYMSEGAPAGHRRWIIYPPQERIGIGDIPTPDGDFSPSNATYVIGGAGARPSVPYVAWPPAAFTPWQVVPDAWSFAADGNADFTNATVSVSKDGVPQSVEVRARGGGFGDPAIEWTVGGVTRTRPAADASYDVQIKGVLIDGRSSDYSYRTTIYDPTPTWFEFAKDWDYTWEPTGSLSLEVLRKGDTSTAVSVAYATVDDSAKAGSDYTSRQGTLSFAPGQTSQTITIPLIDDGIDDFYWEGLRVRLSSPSRGTELGSNRQATRLIGDDDGDYVWMNFNASTTSVGERDGTVAVEVKRGGTATGTDIAISYATEDGTALAGRDYSASAGNLRFAPGVLSQTIRVPILTDQVAEGEESFSIVLTNPTGGAHLAEYDPTLARIRVKITDADAPNPVLAFRVGSVTVAENASNATLEVVRTGVGPGGEISVNFATHGGTATPGADFTVRSGTLRFGPNEASKLITVAILNDQVLEGIEQFTVTLSDPAGAVLGSPATAIVTLEDDDRRPVSQVSVASAELSVSEGAGEAVLSLVRSGDLNTEAEVEFESLPGTASPDTDFLPIVGRIRFQAGQSMTTIHVPILDDAIREAAESFVVRLTAPSSGTTFGGAVSTTVTIFDDDPEPPRVVAYRAVRNRAGLTQIEVDYSQDLQGTGAALRTTYLLRRAGRDRVLGTRDDLLLPIGRVTYASGRHRATLRLSRAFRPREPIQLIVRADALRSTNGAVLDGDLDGQPGGDARLRMRS